MTVGYASTKTAFNKATIVNGSNFVFRTTAKPWNRDSSWMAMPADPTEGCNALYGILPDYSQVAFVASGSYVYLKSHGYVNNSLISFSVINTTTGISINTTYYVVSVTQDTFQLSTSSGGSALTLTNNGTGTAVTSQSAAFALNCTLTSGTFSVDWGDGTTTTGVSSGTQVNKIYDINNSTIVANGKTSKGYGQAMIKITVSVAGALTNINFGLRNLSAPGYGSTMNYSSTGYLDIVIAGTSLTGTILGWYGGGSVPAMNYLERFRWLTCNASAITDVTGLCRNLIKLESVQIPDLPYCGTFNYMFMNCNSLQKAPFFNTSKADGCSQMFSSCYKLVEVPLYNMSNVTNMYAM